MSGTTRGFSLLSSRLGLFKSKPRKINKSVARQGGARALARKNGRNSQVKANPWQAAKIKCAEKCACEAVKQIAGQRFLVRDVPSIPLPECDAAKCKCTYVRFKDRRLAGDERRAFYSMQTQLYGRDGNANERRKKRGRRASDTLETDNDLTISLKNF